MIRVNNLSSADRTTIEYLGLIFKHIREQKTVLFYASQMGISPKHLSETVKQSSGYTAGQIIDSTLLAEAKILLANHQYNINKSAQELGFSDQYSFSKFFKRMMGISPSEYKSQEKNRLKLSKISTLQRLKKS